MKINSKQLYPRIGLMVVLSISAIFQQVTYGQGTADFSIIDTTFLGGRSGTVTNMSRALEYANETSSLSQYGGWLDVQLEATGHFRTTLYKDAWYLVDPDGYLFFGAGPNSVKAESAYASISLPEDLINLGFNHAANWSDYAAINGGSEKIPYVFRALFLQGYKNTTQRTKDLFSDGIVPIFDPAFLTYADNLAQTEVAPNKDDPYCIGVFSDNELPLYTNTSFGELLDRFLGIPSLTDPNYLAAHNWMIDRKGVNYTIDAQDRTDWHGYLVSEYYKKVYTAIKAYAPDMLYLGSRLHAAAKNFPGIYKESAPFVDVFSVNYYGPFEPNTQLLEMWEAESGKPFILSEFYAKGFDVSLDNTGGAGYHVPTQTDRALYFENFVIKLLESKGCVAYQWFKFQDDSSNKGLINASEEWYAPLQNSLIKVNKDIYNLREYLLEQKSRIVRVDVLEDTYTDGNDPDSPKGDIVYAMAKKHTNWERIAYLKFDVSSITKKIASAKLHLNARTTSGPVTVEAYQEQEDSWSENTATANNFTSTQGSLISTFSARGTSYSTPYTIDITDYAEAVRLGDGTLSLAFRLQGTNNGKDFRIVSKEDTEGINTPAYIAITTEAIVSSVNDFSGNTFALYPNPTNGRLTLESPDKMINAVKVFSIDGKQVLVVDKVNLNKLELNIQSLNRGMYLVQLFNQDGGYNTRKLIKN